MTVPQYLDLLPDDLWLLVLGQLAYSVSTAALLNVRLVCKRFSEYITSEQVAYHAVIAANRLVMRNAHGRHPKPVDLPFSWWALLKDQVRLDRIWIKGTKMPPAPHGHFVVAPGADEQQQVRAVAGAAAYAAMREKWAADHDDGNAAGYEVVLLSHGPSSDANWDVLYHDWVRTDVDKITGHGAIAHLTYNRVKLAKDYFITVHVLSYPDLAQIATHTLRHPGFGSSVTDPDLPMIYYHEAGVPPLEFGRGLDVALLHVDYERKTYLLGYSDIHERTLLVLRSFAADSGKNGKTLASFPFLGPIFTAIVQQADDKLRVLHHVPYAPDLVMHVIDPHTLESLSDVMCPSYAYLFAHDHAAHSHPTLVASNDGDVSLWGPDGHLVEWLAATPNRQTPRFISFRPIYRPGLAREVPAKRPEHPGLDRPLHLKREWTQIVCVHDASVGDGTTGQGVCNVLIKGLPKAPPAWPGCTHHLNMDPEVRGAEDTPTGGTWNELTGPAYVAGKVAGHFLFVLQDDGIVSVVDLRAPPAAVEGGDGGVGGRGFLMSLDPRTRSSWAKGAFSVDQSGEHSFAKMVVTGEQAGEPVDQVFDTMPPWGFVSPLDDGGVDVPAQAAAAVGPEQVQAAVGAQEPVQVPDQAAGLGAGLLPQAAADNVGDELGDGEEQDMTMEQRLTAGMQVASDLVMVGERGDAFVVFHGATIALVRRRAKEL